MRLPPSYPAASLYSVQLLLSFFRILQVRKNILCVLSIIQTTILLLSFRAGDVAATLNKPPGRVLSDITHAHSHPKYSSMHQMKSNGMIYWPFVLYKTTLHY